MSTPRRTIEMQLMDVHSFPIKRGEKNLMELINTVESRDDSLGQELNVEDIKTIVTAQNLCSCKNPIYMAFKVNRTLKKLADICTENTDVLKKLADQAEDFAVQLIDQVNAKEELVIREAPKNVDHYASLLTGMTDEAIILKQKKFVSHPLLYKRLEVRWNFGLPEFFKRHRFHLLLFILIDIALTPLMLPIIGFAFHMDQKRYRRRLLGANSLAKNGITPLHSETSRKNILDKYYAYFTTPFVKFVKDKISQLVFIVLHYRVCTLDSTVGPMVEEYLIFVFFCGMVLNEYQQYHQIESPRQYKTSKYFKDVWNYLDVITLIVYVLIVFLRIGTVARGGNPYQNRLLEIVNYLYGVNTLFLILRFSSILGRSTVVGPLQLALFRMCVDVVKILIQFCFVICAFSVAIIKVHIAEMSYLTPPNNQSGEIVTEPKPGFVDISGNLIWSVFSLTELKQMESRTTETTLFALVLYCIFLILTIIMLINMLVALLTNRYDNIRNKAKVEWKFSRTVVESEYRGMHPIVVPFNLLSVPTWYGLFGRTNDADRKVEANNRYAKYYQKHLFPVLTARYKKKYGGSFPLSVEEKIDLIIATLKTSSCDHDENVPEKEAPAKLLGAAGEVIEDGASIVFPLTEGLPRNTNPEEDTISSV